MYYAMRAVVRTIYSPSRDTFVGKHSFVCSRSDLFVKENQLQLNLFTYSPDSQFWSSGPMSGAVDTTVNRTRAEGPALLQLVAFLPFAEIRKVSMCR